MRLTALLLASLLAGCIGASETVDEPTPATPTVAPEKKAIDAAAPEEDRPPVGRAWTYEGTQFYNPETTFTVVVARADADGYLFAAAKEAELVYGALWGDPLHGEVERDLRPEWAWKDLDLPLHDGKSWERREGYTVTARAAEVATPRGAMPGYVIEGKGEDAAVFHAEYVLEIGNFVRIHDVWRNGVIGLDLRMTKVADDQPWVWYELGERVESGTIQSPAQLDVAAGYENVIVSAGGRDGGRAAVQGPGGAPWTHEFTGDETWVHAMLPAAEGKWAATSAGRPFVDGVDPPAEPPVGWAHVVMAPVKWVRSD